jgi:hypothetical protein
MGQRFTEGSPDQREPKLLRDSISLAAREAGLWEASTVGMAGLDGYKEEYDRLGSILLDPQDARSE